MSDDDEVFELDAELDLANQQIRRLKAEADEWRGRAEQAELEWDAARAENERLRAAFTETVDLIRDCLAVAGVAEVIIDEHTARAMLAAFDSLPESVDTTDRS